MGEVFKVSFDMENRNSLGGGGAEPGALHPLILITAHSIFFGVILLINT